eukprot:TRINITY_DN29_c0_g1_i3.p1 TRINITY_DN29_c0_g1~~TRINITY_DN29_c0_g1_i3.p1  ORF type:complete len:159 (+),score=23.77 TRINITY_DN29_c0_g1_i3:310-786(+)
MAQAAASPSWMQQMQSVSAHSGSPTGLGMWKGIKCRKGTNGGMSVEAQAGSPSASSSLDEYDVLGIPHSASKSDVKVAYRRLALQFHPDVCKGDHCEMKFKEVQTAYAGVVRQLDEDSAPEEMSDFCWEGMMGVGDESWSEWEEWMGFEGGVPDLQFQ